MINDKVDEVIKKLFGLLKNRFPSKLELMKSSRFVFVYIHLLYFECHKITPNCGGSYIDPSDWIKNKKTINRINKKDNKCFQYVVTVTLNHEKIKKDMQRIKEIKSFINNIARKEKNVPSGKVDQKKIESNNITIALNNLYAKNKKYILLMFQNITKIVKNKLFFY